MLVVDGRPVELDAHLERMGASLEALFDAGAPPEASEMAVERALGIGLGRLRLTVSPAADRVLRAQVATAEMEPAQVFPSAEPATALRSHVIEGGLGAHKWADRRLLETAEEALPRGSVPLLADRDGAVLEASRANVFAVRGGALLTPPADGRILPGIARRRAIEVAAEGALRCARRRWGSPLSFRPRRSSSPARCAASSPSPRSTGSPSPPVERSAGGSPPACGGAGWARPSREPLQRP